VDGAIVNADINNSAAIALSKLATGALPTAITVASANIVDGTIVNADVNASAAIAGTKISPNFGSQNVVTTGSGTFAGLTVNGTIVTRATSTETSAVRYPVFLENPNAVAREIFTRSLGETKADLGIVGTDLSIGSSTGAIVRIDSSTGTNATLPVASSTLAGVVTNAAQTFGGAKSFTALTRANTTATAATSTTGLLSATTTNVNTGDVAIETTTNNTATRHHISFSNPNGVVGSISTNGSATTYNTSSDYRLKENVVPLTGAIDRLQQIPVYRFNFIADPDTVVDGFIAHEAQEVVPECVTGEKDAVDEDGNPVYQGIDQSKLVPLLTAALQEALAKIETLEARLDAAGIS
jgi:hypothetical protein